MAFKQLLRCLNVQIHALHAYCDIYLWWGGSHVIAMWSRHSVQDCSVNGYSMNKGSLWRCNIVITNQTGAFKDLIYTFIYSEFWCMWWIASIISWQAAYTFKFLSSEVNLRCYIWIWRILFNWRHAQTKCKCVNEMFEYINRNWHFTAKNTFKKI